MISDDATAAPAPVRPVPFPLAGGAPSAAGFPPIDPAVESVDVHAFVGGLRDQLRGAFDGELAKVETAFGSMLDRMEAKLAQAELELAAVRAEHERVKAETERKTAALRDLKKALENI